MSKSDAFRRQAEAARASIESSPRWMRETAVPPEGTAAGTTADSDARLVCSWCGDDFEQGDWASTGCCSCDPIAASALPNVLKDARREAEEALNDWHEDALGWQARVQRLEAALAEIDRVATEAVEGRNRIRYSVCASIQRIARSTRS